LDGWIEPDVPSRAESPLPAAEPCAAAGELRALFDVLAEHASLSREREVDETERGGHLDQRPDDARERLPDAIPNRPIATAIASSKSSPAAGKESDAVFSYGPELSSRSRTQS